ncbi:MAG: response regulator [Nitrospiraceae bacterium]|nr:response regulator [Nitrospiraceae bacterium]
MSDLVRVLVVDDDAMIQDCLKYAMDSYGFHVTTCSSTEAACDHLEKDSYDYVITDYELPGKNGLELIRHVRQKGSDTVIIGISGGDRGIEFLEAGANDFRQKPFIPYEIAMMIVGRDMDDPENEEGIYG